MIDLYDVLAIVGLGAMGYGLSMISVPAALCVVGGVLLLVGMLGAWWKGARK